MHCIVMSSPKGKEAWKIYRSVEILGYHQTDRRVKILFTILAENMLASEPNVLRFLHRGNVRCQVVQSWPLASHPDERDHNVKGILETLYGKAFEESEGHVLRRNVLSCCDVWEKIETQNIVDWPAVSLSSLNTEKGGYLPQEDPPDNADDYVPFCTWTLPPFPEKGLYLIAFSLQFSGETYRRLVEREPTFSVDGPERVLSVIEYDDFVNYGENKLAQWQARLAEFQDDSKRLAGESYDVIILGDPLADDVEVQQEMCIRGIHVAPMQPITRAKRFVTTDQSFTLPLKYARNQRQ